MTRAWLTATVSCMVALTIGVAGGAWAKTAPASPASTAKTVAKTTTVTTTKVPKPRAPVAQVYRAAERVRRGTLEVINDVAQRKMAIFEDDPRDWMPTGAQAEKDSTLWQREMNNLGPLEPPKKSWLDADMGSLQRSIDLLNNEVESLPPAEQTGQSWTDLSSAVAKMNASMKTLTPLCAGPTYDNLKIAQAALDVRDAAKAIIAVTRAEKK